MRKRDSDNIKWIMQLQKMVTCIINDFKTRDISLLQKQKKVMRKTKCLIPARCTAYFLYIKESRFFL